MKALELVEQKTSKDFKSQSKQKSIISAFYAFIGSLIALLFNLIPFKRKEIAKR